MTKKQQLWTWRRLGLAGGLALPILMPLGSALGQSRGPILSVQASPDATSRPTAVQTIPAPALAATTDSAAATAHPYTLAECIQIALQQQPAVNAARSSLAAAEAGRRALVNLGVVPSLLSRDLPYRRKQAAFGVSGASAALDQTERETIYTVTRLYYTVAFAREQKKVTDSVVTNMKVTRDLAETSLKGGSRDVTTSTVDKINVYLGLAQSRQVDAAIGVTRALAALKEAMGLCFDAPLEVAIDTLPEPNVLVDRCEILNLALARRGEIVQAQVGAEVTCLEIKAQGVKRGFLVNTYAVGSDIHARPIPQGYANAEYRPGAIGPEMPVAVAGKKVDREERVRDFYARSLQVVDKTRGLIALEAEDAFLRWQEASNKIALYKDATGRGRKLADDTRNDFATGQKVKAEDVLTNEVLASQSQASYNEARRDLVFALAALERITAGGFCANLTALP